MKNKILIIIILFLLPIAVISFQKEETNFNLPKNTSDIEVKVKIDDNTVTTMPLEEYVLGVVAAEMPASFHEEALKAQAIAARTYTMSKLNKNANYEITGSDQAYITKEEMQTKWQDEYEKYYSKIESAVNTTKGEVLINDQNIITAFYFAMSNGYTEEAKTVFQIEEDYLKSVESSWEDENITKFLVTIYVPKNEFCNKLELTCNNLTITNLKKTNSNRIESLEIENKTFTGIEIRKKLNLRSTDFDININNNVIEITTKGYGHGVGMSQYGANEMAKQNYKYQDILKHYYNDIEIITI